MNAVRQNFATRVVAAVMLIPLLLRPAGARADSDDTIDYRRAIMATLGEQVAAINAILQHKAPSDNFALHLQILASTAAMAKKAFEPRVPGGEAKAAVWSNWADFAKRLDTLVAATAELATSAVDGGSAAAGPRVQAALTCKSCHDTYRDQKPAVAQASEKDAVAYREEIMNTLNDQSEALGMVLSGAVSDDNAVAHLTVIALSARTALKAFEARVPGGEARAEVWSNPADFSKRMTEFAQKTGDLARLAHDKGKDAALANVLDALTCKSCHDVYREETKH